MIRSCWGSQVATKKAYPTRAVHVSAWFSVPVKASRMPVDHGLDKVGRYLRTCEFVLGLQLPFSRNPQNKMFVYLSWVKREQQQGGQINHNHLYWTRRGTNMEFATKWMMMRTTTQGERWSSSWSCDCESIPSTYHHVRECCALSDWCHYYQPVKLRCWDCAHKFNSWANGKSTNPDEEHIFA